jgi:hypothetical protein
VLWGTWSPTCSRTAANTRAAASITVPASKPDRCSSSSRDALNSTDISAASNWRATTPGRATHQQLVVEDRAKPPQRATHRGLGHEAFRRSRHAALCQYRLERDQEVETTDRRFMAHG